MFKYLLILLGLITAVLFIAPQLVVLGYFLLIIPGLILTLIPTLFVYSLTTYLIRLALPTDSPIKGTVIAACLALSLGYLAMIPWRIIANREFKQAALPEITPAKKVHFSGNVLISMPRESVRDKGPVACNAVCTAILDQPEVDSVTRVSQDYSATFRMGPRTAGTLITPFQPHTILDAFNTLSIHREKYSFDAKKIRDQQLSANWAVRIADGEVVRRDTALPANQMDWQITFENHRNKGAPRVQRLEIKDGKGDVLVRKSLVQHRIPFAFFCFGFECGSAGSGFGSAKFTVFSSKVSNQPRRHSFDPEVELLRSTTIPKPNPPADSISQLEQKLSKVLDSGDATDAELLLVPMWLELFQYDAGEEQFDTITKILLDQRISDPYEPLQRALKSRTNLTALREGMAKRFLTATSDKAKTWYLSKLVDMPVGTFAIPTDDELAIWELARADDYAAPFLERLADQGQSSVPDLVDRMNQVIEEPWHRRWRILDGVCKAFKRLGPEAASAIPRVRSFLELRRSPLTNSSNDRKQWLVALCRMGVPADELPFGAWVANPAQLEREAKRIRDQVRRYEAKL